MLKKSKLFFSLLAALLFLTVIFTLYFLFGQDFSLKNKKVPVKTAAFTYFTPNKDLSIDVPENWRVDLSGVSGFPFLLIQYTDTPVGFQGKIPTMSLFVRPSSISLPKPVGKVQNIASSTIILDPRLNITSLSDYVNAVKKDYIPVVLKNFAKNYQLLEDEQVKLKDGTEARLIGTTFDVDYASIPDIKASTSTPAFAVINKTDTKGVEHFRNFHLFVLKNKSLYIFTATANTNDWEGLKEVFKNTLLSIQIKAK